MSIDDADVAGHSELYTNRLGPDFPCAYCCRTETAEFSKDDLYVARYDPIQALLKEGWVHLI